MEGFDKRYFTVEKVVLTPKSEDAGWSVQRGYDGYDCSFDTRFAGGDLIFSAMEWDWEVKYSRTARFRKIVEVVGDAETAERVLDALGER